MSTRKVVTRPPCQIAQCQAPVQACLRPGMWLPGVRNLHSARETWEVKADVNTAIDRLVSAVESTETDNEILEVHKVRCGRHGTDKIPPQACTFCVLATETLDLAFLVVTVHTVALSRSRECMCPWLGAACKSTVSNT
jgi:hypothetical protein